MERGFDRRSGAYGVFAQEEVARDHITRKEVDDRVEKLVVHMDQRFNRIEQKLDDMRKVN